MPRSRARRWVIFAVAIEAALLLGGCATSIPKTASIASGEPNPDLAAEPKVESRPSVAPEPKAAAAPKVASTTRRWKVGQTFSRVHWKRFREPEQSEIAEVLPLFGTYYRTSRYGYASDGIPIVDLSGKPLGPRLSANDFCKAADAGAFRAQQSEGSRFGSYTIAGAPPIAAAQTDCSPFFKTNLDLFEQGKTAENWPSIVAALGRTRFKTTMASYGNGGKGTHRLVPWRTVATYNSQIAQGTILYIPNMRGVEVTLPSGQTAIHDGYFYAADTGSGIKSNHIDFFAGTIAPKSSLLPGLHGKDGRFTAYVVHNDAIAEHFRDLHEVEQPSL